MNNKLKELYEMRIEELRQYGIDDDPPIEMKQQPVDDFWEVVNDIHSNEKAELVMPDDGTIRARWENYTTKFPVIFLREGGFVEAKWNNKHKSASISAEFVGNGRTKVVTLEKEKHWGGYYSTYELKLMIDRLYKKE